MQKPLQKILNMIPFFILILATSLPGGVSYTINHTWGIVRDNNTGLVWMRCTLLKSGINPDSFCNNTTNGDKYTWEESINACNALNTSRYRGYSSWRLPSIRELQSIVDFTNGLQPATNERAFPNTKSEGYWSSTAHFNDPSGIKWFINFFNGTTSWNFPSSEHFVRCVAGP